MGVKGATGMLSKGERQALSKANKLGGAALVMRVAFGVYRVPSATDADAAYTVTGFSLDGGDYRCNCPAGEAGRPCWHKASLRLRKVQEAAKAQARKLAQRQPAAPVHTSTVVLRVGGVEYVGTGAHRLEALANATPAA